MHGHSHDDGTRAFAWVTLINLAYTVLEAGYGFATDSLALLSDALHNFGDVLGLGLAWGAAVLARRAPTERHTYGWRRATLLSPLANAMLLVMIESLADFGNPILLGGGTPFLATEVFLAIEGRFDPHEAAVYGVVLLALALALFLIQRRWLAGVSVVTVSGRPSRGRPAPDRQADRAAAGPGHTRLFHAPYGPARPAGQLRRAYRQACGRNRHSRPTGSWQRSRDPAPGTCRFRQCEYGTSPRSRSRRTRRRDPGNLIIAKPGWSHS